MSEQIDLPQQESKGIGVKSESDIEVSQSDNSHEANSASESHGESPRLLTRYLVQLPQFEGPLALLLFLIRKEEMDIFNIDIHQITAQYLEHIKILKDLDLELAGDFVAMAATLLQIKSRMLLPQYNEEGETIETEDPRKELVQKLLDYQKFQDAAKRLNERPLLNRDLWTRGTKESFVIDEDGIVLDDDGLFGLIASYRRAMKKAERLVHRVRPKTQSIADRVLEVAEFFKVGARLLLSDLSKVGPLPTRTQLLITFLSLLELGRLGFVSLFQNEVYGEIYIEPKKPIERNVLERVQEFDSQNAEAVAQSIIQDAEVRDVALAEQKLDLEVAPESELEMQALDASSDVSAFVAQEGSATDEELLNAEKELGIDEGSGEAMV